MPQATHHTIVQTPLPRMTLDRRAFFLLFSFDTSEETRYWWAQSPEERLRHIERLRRINYGDQAAARLQRVLEIAPRAPR